MKPIYVAFTVCHVLSMTLALLTCMIIGTPNPSAKPPTSPRHISFAYRLLRIACICVALMSFTILLPGMLFDFKLTQGMICWSQGLILHWVFLSLHLMISILALHNWFLIVRWNFEAESKYERVYWAIIAFAPLLVILVCVVSAGITSHWFHEDGYGITPRPGYCFWGKPYLLRLVGYGVPYFLSTLMGALFSLWVAVTLLKIRYKSPGANTPGSTNTMFLSVSRSTLYRTTFFALFYTAIGAMSFVPSMIRYIHYMENDHEEDERTSISASEFSSALAGIGLFLVFGTGEQMKFFWYRLVRRHTVTPSAI
jgi:hypothetical protein